MGKKTFFFASKCDDHQKGKNCNERNESDAIQPLDLLASLG